MGTDEFTIPRDYRDLVIEDLTDSETELLECVTALEADVDMYRELALAAFDGLHDLTVTHNNLQRQHRQVQDEFRWLRERVLVDGGAV
jgi:hypothetical protein